MKSGNDCYNRKDRLTERGRRGRFLPHAAKSGTPFKKIREVIDLKTVKTAKKRRANTAAAIDIGSKLLRMRIAQMSKGNLQDLEYLEYPTSIGHEVFTNGKISFESIRALSSALHGFSKLMEEYGVSSSRVVATTALREADNRAFVVDQLKVQNGMQVEILEDNQEKAYVYGEIAQKIPAVAEEGVDLYSYIGTGSVGVAVVQNGLVVFSKNVPVGVLKLRDMLGDLQNATNDFHEVLEEYIHVSMGRFISVYPGGFPNISRLVLSGNGSSLVARLCGAKQKNGVFQIASEKISELYRAICRQTPEKISFAYRITDSDAELLYSTLALYLYLINLTGAKTVYAPPVDLLHPMLREMLTPKNRDFSFVQLRESTLACVRLLAGSFQCDMKHSEQILIFAETLFDKMKEIHGLDARRRLLLDTACLLHECGYCTQPRQYSSSAFHLIRSMDIYGITENDLYLVASAFLPADDTESILTLTPKQRLVVSKLAALFRLADALDQSQKQKLRNLKVRLDKNRLLVTAESSQNTSLEEWAFAQKVPFFEEVFGIQPELTIHAALPSPTKHGKV